MMPLIPKRTFPKYRRGPRLIPSSSERPRATSTSTHSAMPSSATACRCTNGMRLWAKSSRNTGTEKKSRKHQGPQMTDSTESWGLVYGAMKTHDCGMIERWKDELNNLLIFAGLFSAVATAFTLKSLEWLEQDPAGTSATLLQRVTMQLGSFASSANFVNSTIPSLPQDDLSLMFVPSSLAIQVNILWTLSLTLSLIVTFFAITVQQWLREYTTPVQASVRMLASLNNIRHTGLLTGRVAEIISLLPILLQTAVILFLSGLLRLLYHLHHTVAQVISVICGISLVLFIFSSVLPLSHPRYPYKTPLIPIIFMLWRSCAYLPMRGAAIIVYVTRFCYITIAQWRSTVGTDRYIFITQRLSRWLVFLTRTVNPWFKHPNSFWADKEAYVLLNEDGPLQAQLDVMSGIPRIFPLEELSRVQACLQDFSQPYRTRIVYQWLTILGISVSHSELAFNDLAQANWDVLANINHEVARYFGRILLHAIPRQWDTDWIQEDPYLCRILFVSNEIAKRHPDVRIDTDDSFRQQYVQLLLMIRDNQRLVAHSTSHKDLGRSCIPTVLLYDYYSSTRDPDLPDIVQCLHWTYDAFSIADATPPDAGDCVGLQEMVLSSVAVSLTVARADPLLLANEKMSSHIVAQIIALNAFFAAYKIKIRSTVYADMITPGVQGSCITTRALGTISLCLSSLVMTASLVGVSVENSMGAVGRLVEHIVDVFDGLDTPLAFQQDLSLLLGASRLYTESTEGGSATPDKEPENFLPEMEPTTQFESPLHTDRSSDTQPISEDNADQLSMYCSSPMYSHPFCRCM